jgi:hypothetical protein
MTHLTVEVNEDELWPYFTASSEISSSVLPRITLTDEEFEDYLKTMQAFFEWQHKLRKVWNEAKASDARRA